MSRGQALFLLLAVAASPAIAGHDESEEQPGKAPYDRVCLNCHGPGGSGDIAPTLVPLGYDAEYMLLIVREGYVQMPQISEKEISDEEVKQVVTYLESLSKATEETPDAPPAP